MYQYDDPTAVSSRPAPSAAGTPGWFSDGNPSNGSVATILRAEFMNMIMAELLSVLNAAGIEPDKTQSNQLLLALRSGFMFNTAAQFDTSTAVATMEAVQRALGNFQTGVQLQANTTLAPADVGKVFQIAAASLAINLPLLSAVPKGSSVTFVNNASPGTVISVQGTNKIIVGGQSNLTSVSLPAGESLTLTSVDGGNWFATGGTAMMPYSNLFLKNIGTSGYQKLPGGLIIQWGYLASPGTSGTITFPLSFPNTLLSITPGQGAAVAGNNGLAFNISGNTSTITYAQSASTAFCWLAIGY